MKINFDQVLLELDKSPMTIEEEKPKQDNPKEKERVKRSLTLRDVCVRSLLFDFWIKTPDDRLIPETVDGQTKHDDGNLADRIYGCKEPIVIKSEDVTRLKMLIARRYDKLVTYRAHDLLDGVEPDSPADSPAPAKDKQ